MYVFLVPRCRLLVGDVFSFLIGNDILNSFFRAVSSCVCLSVSVCVCVLFVSSHTHTRAYTLVHVYAMCVRFSLLEKEEETRCWCLFGLDCWHNVTSNSTPCSWHPTETSSVCKIRGDYSLDNFSVCYLAPIVVDFPHHQYLIAIIPFNSFFFSLFINPFNVHLFVCLFF